MQDENQSESESQQFLDKPPLIWRMDSHQPQLIWGSDAHLSNYSQNSELDELSGERNAYEKQFYNYLLPVDLDDKISHFAFKITQFDSEQDSDWPQFQYVPKETRETIDPSPLIPTDSDPNFLLQTSPKIVQQKNQSKFKNKSYCRYILLYAFRTLEKQQYVDTIQEICSRNNVNFEIFRAYYTKQRLVIQGYQVLKRELIITNDLKKEVVQRKMAFQEYLIWYLDRIATKDILSSKKMDLKEYIKYKNDVMCYYIRFPDKWNGNKAEWL